MNQTARIIEQRRESTLNNHKMPISRSGNYLIYGFKQKSKHTSFLVATIIGLSIFGSLSLVSSVYANPCTANVCPVVISQQVNVGNNFILFRDILSSDNSTANSSLDKTSYLVGDAATLTINDFNENLDINAIDAITATVNPSGSIVTLSETGGTNTGIFTGSFPVTPGFSGITYPTEAATGRLGLTLNGVTGAGTAQFSDYIITSNEAQNLCFNPVLQPVSFTLSGVTLGPSKIGLSMPWTNALLGDQNFFTPDLLQMWYKPNGGGWRLVADTDAGFPGYHNFVTNMITNDPVHFAPITQSGLVTLGFANGCSGSSGGGLVSAGLVLNFLAGAGASENGITPPSFGGTSSHFSDGLTLIQGTQKTIFDTSKYNQEIPTQVLVAGNKVNMDFKTFESYNPAGVVHMGLYIIPRGQDMVTSNSIGSIIWEKGKPVEVNDPNHILSDTSASVNLDGKFQHTQFSFTPTKSYDKMSFLARAWNDHLQSADIRVHDAPPEIVQQEVYPAGVYKFTDWSALYVKLTNDGFEKPKITNHIQGVQSMNGGDSGLQVYWLYDTNVHKISMIIKESDGNKVFEKTEILQKADYLYENYCDLKVFQNACTTTMLYRDSPDFHTWYSQHMTPDTIQQLKQMGFWEN